MQRAMPFEPCNGIDDNRTGEIDEDCPCTPFSTMVPGATATEGPGLAWL